MSDFELLAIPQADLNAAGRVVENVPWAENLRVGHDVVNGTTTVALDPNVPYRFFAQFDPNAQPTFSVNAMPVSDGGYSSPASIVFSADPPTGYSYQAQPLELLQAYVSFLGNKTMQVGEFYPPTFLKIIDLPTIAASVPAGERIDGEVQVPVSGGSAPFARITMNTVGTLEYALSVTYGPSSANAAIIDAGPLSVGETITVTATDGPVDLTVVSTGVEVKSVADSNEYALHCPSADGYLLQCYNGAGAEIMSIRKVAGGIQTIGKNDAGTVIYDDTVDPASAGEGFRAYTMGTAVDETAFHTLITGLSGTATGILPMNADMPKVASYIMNGSLRRALDNPVSFAGLGLDTTTYITDAGEAITILEDANDGSDVKAASFVKSSLPANGTQAQTSLSGATRLGKLPAFTAAATETNVADFQVDETAVDPFVWDVSQDSDGGAWATDYPKMMVLVATSSVVKIYDGLQALDRLVQTIDVVGETLSCVSALNGVVYIGTGSGLYEVNLSAGETSPTLTHSTSTTPSIVNNTVNDVAMTVLPNAPTNPATGLPVPTIAVATEGGVSVIKDDGTVVDSATTLGVSRVFFDALGGIFYKRNTTTGIFWYSTKDDYTAGDGFGDEVARTTAGTNSFDILAYDSLANNFTFTDGKLASGGTSSPISGLMLHQPNYTDQTKGMSALLTSTYNTGWMTGDVKGCYLCDTDDTDLVGGTDADRSVNNNPLPITGTATRTKDAGEELVWYNLSDDCTVTLDSDISTSGMVTWWEKVSGTPTLYCKDLSGGTDYVNGVAGTIPAGSIEFSGPNMTIKAGKTMRVVRPSATVSTADQVAKTYADESVAFAGSCTLYGNSDAVTALAHDDVTGLLEVGTSDGRSTFDGLQRIRNTTTPVTTAISAANGLIAEQ